jgi:hypothetical protein
MSSLPEFHVPVEGCSQIAYTSPLVTDNDVPKVIVFHAPAVHVVAVPKAVFVPAHVVVSAVTVPAVVFTFLIPPLIVPGLPVTADTKNDIEVIVAVS